MKKRLITMLLVVMAVAMIGCGKKEETTNAPAPIIQEEPQEIAEAAELDGMMELSEEDLLSAGITEIESLDAEADVIAEDYLDTGMQVAETADGELLAEATPEEGEIPGEAVFTSTDGVTILSDAKRLKEQTRAQKKEELMEIINNPELTDTQKQDAVNSLVEMTDYAEKEAAAEILLEAKGYSDVVVYINGFGVDVVVNATELSDIQREQIEDAVTRKTDIAAENIVISTVVQ